MVMETKTIMTLLIGFLFVLTIQSLVFAEGPADTKKPTAKQGVNVEKFVKNGVMMFADSSRGPLFAKDPAVVKFKGQYFLYYSILPGNGVKGWRIGIATSKDMLVWEKKREMKVSQECEKKGFCAPGAIVIRDQLHLFYQTYGNGRNDAICHAWSADGLNFTRNRTNPIFKPTGSWTAGRAIDADVIEHEGKLLLYYSTRDPDMKIQMQGVSSAPIDSDFTRDQWKQLNLDGPILKPELRWEKRCIEAAALCKREGKLYMFYAGGYNNEPQQIGCAVSTDGVSWTRLFKEPLLPNGKKGEWNSSESGHPYAFTDDDGTTYLFYQGNNNHGKSWFISMVKIGWKDGKPFVDDEKYHAWEAQTKPIYQEPDSDFAKDPSVYVSKDGTFYMFYTGSCYGFQGGTHPWRIDYATSTDGVTWNKKGTSFTADENEVVMAPTRPIWHKGTYYMYYGVGSTMTKKDRTISKDIKIGYATSTDLKNWIRHPEPVISHPNIQANDPFVFKEGDTFYLFYNTYPKGGQEEVYFRTSSDLKSWSKPVKTDAWGEGSVVWKEGDMYCLITAIGYSGKGEEYHLFTSKSLQGFKHHGPLNIRVPDFAKDSWGHGDVIFYKNQYRLYFQGTSTHGKTFQVGLAYPKLN